MTAQTTRLARFFVVGASGVGVNMGLLILLTESLGCPYAISSLFAIELSILSNFALNNAWTWSDRRASSFRERLVKYHLVAGFTAFTANWGLLILLTRFFGLDYRISNLLGIAAGMVLNFALNHTWTFGAPSVLPRPAGSRFDWERLKHCLDLRGISPRWNATVVILLALALGLRVLAMARMTLVPEEAYYWMYSQHPSLSYYDHPPMVAWLIWMGTHLFGNTEFGVRIGVALMMLAASGMMYVFSRIWFGREAALVAALLLQILPVYFGAGLIATMDSALLFFWLVCLVGVSVALRRQQTWGWYLAGAGLGGAILSKYTGIFLGLGALLAVAGYRPWRRHLLSPHPYAATLLAFAMFAPVLVWNAQHEWASFRFQFLDRFADQPASVASMGAYALLQLAVATPLVLAGLGFLCVKLWRNRRRRLAPRWWMVLGFSLPLLLVMGYKSLRYDIHLNWTLPAYLSVFPAVAWGGLAQWRGARRKPGGFAWSQATLATVVGCLSLNVLALVYLLTLQPRTGWISAFGPWRELAAEVESVENRLEKETGQEPLIIASGKYRLASVLAFYRTSVESKVRASDFTTSQWILGGQGLGYPYWAKTNRWLGSDCIVVNENENTAKFAARLKQFELVDEFHSKRTTYHIGIGRGLPD